MSETTQWITFVLIGLGTFAIRLSFIELHTVLRIPPLFRRALAYVPASVLAALVLPAVVFPDRHAGFDWTNPQLPAAILAALVAWRTRSTMLTLVVGMGVLWALKHWGL
ncbi:AzlD domain-containing protein [Pseudomonas monteilii]|uniref:AzlD domain-containing protein n=2 Tax=Pseudomonas TaxID=286 RepID=A0A6G6V2K4_9PSED|nr:MULTISPECIES: AzlD domain-containing protein [Pseudomonas]AVH37600.1 AzlD domain-containing protein [Pseudomonas monteilii]MBA6137322.1 AzlD domain-containing protein [Pseudomonas monteilii]MBV4516750.1 AzlD domain-containing protein [Pseudomonas kurunegalensis]MBZ3662285.1 AzlD domain-containing protein [Pseudomonas monteilii]MBZ3667611.1 AzlD domain-containing protein [Pseudomonas monteilii]